jgi:heptosyltransferase II
MDLSSHDAAPRLLIRMPNYIGDVVLAIPAIEALTNSGFKLILLGKPWMTDLLAPWREHGWRFAVLPKSLANRVRLLRALKSEHVPRNHRGLNAIVFPRSFSSALEFKLGGWNTLGFASEGRSFLLSSTWTKDEYELEMQRFNALASVYLHGDDRLARHLPIPRFPLGLEVSADVASLLGSLPYICICPFAGGLFQGVSKEWPHFPEFAQWLVEQGHRVVVCPGGSAELDKARSEYANCTILPNTTLQEYAAILKGASKVFSNDTGPAHIAAAVGARLYSVLRKEAVSKYFPQGDHVAIIQGLESDQSGWPTVARVQQSIGFPH